MISWIILKLFPSSSASLRTGPEQPIMLRVLLRPARRGARAFTVSCSFPEPPARLAPSFLRNGPLSNPTFALGNEVFVKGTTAMVCLPSCDPYFDAERTTETIAWATSWFSDTIAFIPGSLYSHVFEIQGLPAAKARRRALLCETELAHLAEEGYELSFLRNSAQSSLRVPSWNADIARHPAFSMRMHAVRERFYDSALFRAEVYDACYEIVAHHSRKDCTMLIDRSIDLAREFLLRKLAFLWGCNDILDARSPLVLINHERWPLFERFAAGHFFKDERPLEHVGLLVVYMDQKDDGCVEE